MIRMTVSACPARTISCTGRRGAPAEVFSVRGGGDGRAEKASAGAPRRPVQEIVRGGRAETVILIILIILWIILLAFHPYSMITSMSSGSVPPV